MSTRGPEREGAGTVQALTEKDLRDLDWAAAHPVEYIALSFVRRAEDVARLRSEMAARGIDARIIAKIYYAFGLLEAPSVLEAQRANFSGAVDAQTRSLAVRESLVALQEREQCERRIGKVTEADADLARIAQLSAPQ